MPPVPPTPAPPPPLPIECILRCAAIPEPAGPDLETLSTWGFELIQHYEICAARHNQCAARLGEQRE